MNITIILLAAGHSRRFGGDKRHALLADGTPILQRTATRALASDLPVLVCLRPGDEKLAVELEKLGAQTHYCELADLGMGHSLAAGMERILDEDGVLIALGDMPYIQPSSYIKVAAALAPGTIAVPQFQGMTGHPVGFSRDYFPDLASLTGDHGAKQVIRRNGDAVTPVAVSDTGILADIDRPADLKFP